MRRRGLTTLLGAAALAAGACSRPTAAPPAGDDGLARDLDAAQAHAAADARTARTQFVSPLELGQAPEAAEAAPRRTTHAAPRTSARAPARATPIARVARASADAPEAAAPAADTPHDAGAGAPNGPVRAEPAPPPARDEPVVAAPSRRPADDLPLPAPRRGRVWSTGDVIRNAPFPINP